MATAKKTPTPKKKTTTKTVKARPLTWKFYATSIGIFVIAISTVIVAALFTAHYVQAQNNSERLGKIKDIYSSLQIDAEKYPIASADVFGEKRPYAGDKSRSYSSAISYTHGDTVTNTFKELDEKIQAAGFTFISEPYPGSAQKQYHYESENGAYIRLSVGSKVYEDTLYNKSLMGEDIDSYIDEAWKTIDQGPSNVTIKVNLDDNNE